MNQLKSTISILLYLIIITYISWNTSPVNGQPNNEKKGTKFSIITDSDLAIRTGKHEYEMLLERRKSIYGSCWSNIIQRLEYHCQHLDENVQSMLAIMFTNCFMKTSGYDDSSLGEYCRPIIDKETPSVESEFNNIQRCTKSLDPKVFHAYSLFFVHTQSICFYLRSEQWQQQTENLVDSLVQSGQIVSNELNVAVDKIAELEQLQNSSLNAQLMLNDDITEARKSLQQFKEQTKEQRDLIEKIIDQFVLLRQFMVVELSTNSAIIFYIFAMFVIYLMTTPKRTIGVRIWLYLTLMITFIIEKRLIDWIACMNIGLTWKLLNDDPTFDSFGILANVWTIRKLMTTIMTGTYIWWMITYRDISQINYRLLNENTMLLKNIHHQLLEKQYSIVDYSDSDSCSSIGSLENDSDDESFVSSGIDSDLENIPTNRVLRKRDPIKKQNLTQLPKKYQDESVSMFVKRIRSTSRGRRSQKEHFYSSDED